MNSEFATPSKRVKSAYHKFMKNPANRNVSLKEFARITIKHDQTEFSNIVRTWFSYKNGDLERLSKAERIKNKGTRIALEKAATKLARKRVKTTSAKPSSTSAKPKGALPFASK